MKAYDAFSSWATLNMAGLLSGTGPVLSGTGPVPGTARRPGVRPRGRATAQRPVGWIDGAGLERGGHDPHRAFRDRGRRSPGTGPAGRSIGFPLLSHLPSFEFVV